MEALDGEPVGDQGGVQAGLENGKEVADVVKIVVGQEHPPDVGGVDNREQRIEPLRLSLFPVSTITGPEPVITMELMGTTVLGAAGTVSGITQVSGAVRYGSWTCGSGTIMR